MHGSPKQDQRPPLNAVLFDLDDTLVDHSAALLAGALALAEAAPVTGDRAAFAARWKAIQAEKYPRYLRGELRYEDMCRERIWEAVDPSLSPAQADALFATYMSAYHTAWRLFDTHQRTGKLTIEYRTNVFVGRR